MQTPTNNNTVPDIGRPTTPCPAVGRYWLLTIPKDKWKPCLPDGVQWCKGQQEVGANGFEHWQVCAAWPKNVRLSTVKKAFCIQAHAELTRSSKAEEYVWKDETGVQGGFIFYDLPWGLCNFVEIN